MGEPAILRHPVIVMDVTDLERSATFWGRLLGVVPGRPRSHGDYLTVGPLAEGAMVVLQRVETPHRGKNPVHLDFQVDDVEEALRVILDLGGSRRPTQFTGEGATAADPDGNEFCIAPYSPAEC